MPLPAREPAALRIMLAHYVNIRGMKIYCDNSSLGWSFK